MKPFQIAYIPIGVPTFHLESAQIQFDQSIEMLKSLSPDCVFPSEMLLTMDKLQGFLDTISPQLVIVQNITFANAAYITKVLKLFSCPVLLWTLREPVIDGGRLRLNSLTGAYSAGNTLMYLREGNFQYIFGSPQEQRVKDTIQATMKAAQMKEKLSQMKVAAIGHTPQGFGFGRALDVELAQVFGVTLESIEARELIDVAKTFSPEDCKEYMDIFHGQCCGHEETAQKNKEDFAKLFKAYKEYIQNNGIDAISSRCWPDFFTSYGTPVCAVLSLLNHLGIPASCEADTFGALSMVIAKEFSGKPVFFGDPVSLDETENTITFWHCGMADTSLAQGEKAQIGVHPNRRIGPVMDFGCKPSPEATIFRIGKTAQGGFRFFLCSGEILEKEKQFEGTSIVVKTENPSLEVVNQSVQEGWEPHFVVAYGDIREELSALGKMLGIPLCTY